MKMSGLSYADDKSIDWTLPGIVDKAKKFLKVLFESDEVKDHARIWHGDFSYKLVSGTTIRSIYNIGPVTSIDAGNCYVCVFDQPDYRGDYRIIGPGEKIRAEGCKSIVTSVNKIPVDAIRQGEKAPEGFWELDGPMYIMHFSSSYRYI
jgi:hypothetical protein